MGFSYNMPTRRNPFSGDVLAWEPTAIAESVSMIENMKILIATEKPFAKKAVDGIKAIFAEAGYETILLEKYTDKSQLLAAVADVQGLIVRSDKVTAEVLRSEEHTSELQSQR